ncbi:hypothetical protein T439DRAFT_383591 [Meredithblackwellia eburnea MCA 4105]
MKRRGWQSLSLTTVLVQQLLRLSLPLLPLVQSAPSSQQWTAYNLNQNPSPTASVVDFTGTWSGHSYTPSPANWRQLPTYTIMLDRWFDGSPDNNDLFDTGFEWDANSNQLRFGGDILGLIHGNGRALDYLSSMGVKVIYIAGTPFINLPWGYDGYSPLDFTILDPHFGTIDDWRTVVDQVHQRGMYIMLDFTISTMADLLEFKGFTTSQANFTLDEHAVSYKPNLIGPLTYYPDFNFTNTLDVNCVLPDFWNEDGSRLTLNHTGCFTSEFDQYGVVDGVNSQPWQRQLSKSAGVQDRLRDFNPSVAAKINTFGCLIIQMLDIDAIRIDKATQMTLQFMADWSTATRDCARKVGKNNFFIPGEVTPGNTFGSLYVGRGRTPSQVPVFDNLQSTDPSLFLRNQGNSAIDGEAFHYSIFRTFQRFFGLEGNITAPFDTNLDFVDAWNQMLTTNDFFNAETGLFDPRHMFGVSNQDNMRWPALVDGQKMQILGSFVSQLLLPGIPIALWGEEQGFYLLDNTAANYIFGRQPMASAPPWQEHGCYHLGSSVFNNLALNSSSTGCNDDWNSLDHLDSSAPALRVIARMNQLRTIYPAISDGFGLSRIGNWTTLILHPNSDGPTEVGVRSIARGFIDNQNISPAIPHYNTTVWMLYSNSRTDTTVTEDCAGAGAIFTPWPTTVGDIRNLLYPYDTLTPVAAGTQQTGCIPSYTIPAYGFSAYVPSTEWVAPTPILTGFAPGHDARLINTGSDEIDLRFEFDTDMDCTSLTNSLKIVTEPPSLSPALDASSVNCGFLNSPSNGMVGSQPSAWGWIGKVRNAGDGIYLFSISNVTSTAGVSSGVTDSFIVRKGSVGNIMVNKTANTDSGLLTQSGSTFSVNHQATGASLLRYSTDFGDNWSPWSAYEATTSLQSKNFNSSSNWSGKARDFPSPYQIKVYNLTLISGAFFLLFLQHVKVQYYSNLTGSASHVVTGDLDSTPGGMRFPGWIIQGVFNMFGEDIGLPNRLSKSKTNDTWSIASMQQFPTWIQFKIPNSNSKTSADYYLGDVDQDGILDRLSPVTLSNNIVNLTNPPWPHLAYTISVDSTTLKYSLSPRGNVWVQIVMFILFAIFSPLAGLVCVLLYRWAYYRVVPNYFGTSDKKNIWEKIQTNVRETLYDPHPEKDLYSDSWPENPNAKRKVLIATLEVRVSLYSYEIFGVDPAVKVRIGGLGAMASLIAKTFVNDDLIWVVPKVGDAKYQPMTPERPITVTVSGRQVEIQVETHIHKNVKWYVLDDPIFKEQKQKVPYPARMDDAPSGRFYSTWNQCIAEVIRRTPGLTIYHINDYHGSLAPYYLLPKIIPVCLSLHNAEFQGLWPLRNEKQQEEVSRLFNLPTEVIHKYIQYGSIFNLLHAASAYIAYHQKSVGVAGVSDNYGKRALVRYPALWLLDHVDSLPNPNPDDTKPLDEEEINLKDIKMHKDPNFEKKRPGLRLDCQRWTRTQIVEDEAGGPDAPDAALKCRHPLREDPNAELFVFVGRWSKQKGVDLIADVFPAILKKNSKVQLLCLGPVIDLYGAFAARKLQRLSEMFPGQVYSRPVFTKTPPFINSGAEFALIPSRDEPFGLVAVEFASKGALGVGSLLGGLGLAPGWWFPVESDSTTHMHEQFQKTIAVAMKAPLKKRQELRARAALQRFPVAQWVQRTDEFYKRSVLSSRKLAKENAYTWDLADEYSYPPPPQVVLPPSQPPPEIVLDAAAPLDPVMETRGRRPPRRGASFLEEANEYMSNINNANLAALLPVREGSAEPSPLSSPLLRPTDLPSPSLPPGAYDPQRSPRLGPVDPQGSAPNSPLLRPLGDRRLAGSSTSLVDMAGEDNRSALQGAMKDFVDADGAVARKFSKLLQRLSADNSTTEEFCVDAFLVREEEEFLNNIRQESRNSALITSSKSRDSMVVLSVTPSFRTGEYDEENDFDPTDSHRLFDEESLTSRTSMISGPGRTRRRLNDVMLMRIGDWPLYCISLSIGQLLSAGTFQLVLLSGSATQTSDDLYIVGTCFCIGTPAWWFLSQSKPLTWTLSLPFIFFAMAFILVGLPSVITALATHQFLRHATSLTATCMYAFGSSAGWAFFSKNFAEESAGQTSTWIWRACIVEGSQQLWVAALWYWGYRLRANNNQDVVQSRFILIATVPLAALCLTLAIVNFLSLPPFYHQSPGHIPRFIRALFHRKLVWWFLFSQVLSLYWLSTPYGRNWAFLWQSLWALAAEHIPTWATVIMVAFFFIVVWTLILLVLAKFSVRHTWVFPIFAVGLGAPRWCQMMWGTSTIALYVPWLKSVSRYLSSALWLWLGLLDSLQGVGIGMVLLQTLSRDHVGATLALAQVVGSVVVIVARLSSPDKDGPGGVFPCFGLWNPNEGLANSPFTSWTFWVGLLCQAVISWGYLLLFRTLDLYIFYTLPSQKGDAFPQSLYPSKAYFSPIWLHFES